MLILPAIDIKNGQCVRLTKGDFSTVQKVAENPLETALSFQNCGAEWIHMVDLDGAKDKKPVNTKIYIDIAENTDLKVEVGGGIRNMETVEFYLSHGISRVILGSVALTNRELVKKCCDNYGEKIAVGIDALNRKVAADGWLNGSNVDFIELAKMMEQVGVHTIIYTDISKDGTLSGPNLEQLNEINNAVSSNIIASGGIKDINNIKDLKNMGLYGAICGKSVYSGSLSLKDAIVTAR